MLGLLLRTKSDWIYAFVGLVELLEKADYGVIEVQEASPKLIDGWDIN